MIVGYLHIGPRPHGTHRYGRLLAAEVATETETVEASIELGHGRTADSHAIEDAAHALQKSDVVHIQYGLWDNTSLWGPGWTQLANLKTFAHACGVPIVATVHDVYPFHVIRSLVRRRRGAGDPPDLSRRHGDPSRRDRWIAATLDRVHSIGSVDVANAWTLRWLFQHAGALLFLSEAEANRIRIPSVRRKAHVIAHFVERRSPAVSARTAREMCGAGGKKTVTLMGYIHNGKGHALLVEAMRDLPEDVRVVFAGGPSPGAEPFLERLLARAQEIGVDERLVVTGFLPEDELEPWMVATDLAVCPFRLLSASSSLAGWLSLHRPVLASRLPQIDELNAIAPGAIQTFEPYAPEVLAREIRRLLPSCDGAPNPGSARLQERLAIPIIAQQHRQLYRQAHVAGRGGTRTTGRRQRIAERRVANAVEASAAPTVVMVPSYPTNPYQRLLGAGLGDLGVPVTMRSLHTFSRPGSGWRITADVLHLHWTQGFVIGGNGLRSCFKLFAFALNLMLARLRGTRLVWTIHELHDHDRRNPRLDALANLVAARACHAFITHCPTAREAAVSQLRLDRDRVHVIPIGHYMDVYPNAIPRADARRSLDVPRGALIFLFFGVNRPYKGIRELVEAFSRLGGDDVWLLIAGPSGSDAYERDIRSAIAGEPRVRLHAEFVPDRRVQVFLNACDCTVFPYRDVMSSSSIKLSMSFGRPTIAPRIGCVADDLDASESFLYDPGTDDALYLALCEAVRRRQDLDEMGAKNRTRAQALSWRAIATRTLSVYEPAARSTENGKRGQTEISW